MALPTPTTILLMRSHHLALYQGFHSECFLTPVVECNEIHLLEYCTYEQIQATWYFT